MTSARLDSVIFTRVVSDELFERAGQGKPRHAWHRARGLPALGIPIKQRRRRLATVVSVVIHFLVVWLLLRPEALTNINPDLILPPGTGGGEGPAGGGGGGTRGSGGVKYVQVAPPPVTPPTPAPVVPPVQPVLEVPKPIITEPVLPQMEIPKLATTDPKAEVKVQSPIIGVGGGTGNDGTRGNGPGTGGGIGSGIGTGRGSGVGPGTGGGPGDNYVPTLIEMPLLPMDTPAKVKGFLLKVVFEIDEKGKVVDFQFTPTRDGDFNRKIRDVLRTFKFRPAVTPDGTPIKGKYPFEWNF
jgi:protein TonB